MKRTNSEKNTKKFDPIQPVAVEISQETALICLDEFQVNKFIVTRALYFCYIFEIYIFFNI